MGLYSCVIFTLTPANGVVTWAPERAPYRGPCRVAGTDTRYSFITTGTLVHYDEQTVRMRGRMKRMASLRTGCGKCMQVHWYLYDEPTDSQEVLKENEWPWPGQEQEGATEHTGTT
jgi:hypothetical protein